MQLGFDGMEAGRLYLVVLKSRYLLATTEIDKD